MEPDLTPYTSVTPELEEAERDAFLAALSDATEQGQTLALAWVQQFQRMRGIMQLAMAGIIRPGVEDGEVGFQLVEEFDEEGLERIVQAGLFVEEKDGPGFDDPTRS